LPLSGTWTAAKFDVRQVDSFDRWSGRRAVLLASANARGGRSGRGLMRRGSYSGLYTANSPIPGADNGDASGSSFATSGPDGPAPATGVSSPSAEGNPFGSVGIP